MTTDDAPPDYSAIEPPDRPGPDAHYTKRRAYIRERIREAGIPSAVSQADLADVFDVDKSTISRDFDRIAESEAEHNGLGGDRARFTLDAVFQTAMRELLADESWKDAASVADDYAKFLGRIGAIREEPDKQRVVSDVSVTAHGPELTTGTGTPPSGDDAEPFLSEQSAAHLDALAAEADAATAPLTDDPDPEPAGRDHDHDQEPEPDRDRNAERDHDLVD